MVNFEFEKKKILYILYKFCNDIFIFFGAIWKGLNNFNRSELTNGEL